MLSDKQIKALKPKSDSYYETDDTGRRGYGRLAVKVNPNGAKTFYFAYKMDGKRKFIPLGSYPELPLADARKSAEHHGQLLFTGKDPRTVLEEQAKQDELVRAEEYRKSLEGNVVQLFELYLAKLQRDRSERHYKCAKKVLDGEVLKILGAEIKANKIEPEHIASALRPSVARGSLVMSNRVRSYLSAAFAFGMQYDLSPDRQENSPLFRLKFNPVSAVPKTLKSEKPSERVLTEAELQRFWQLIEKSHLVAERKLLLKLMISFGGLRVTEIIEAPWSEFDLTAGLWNRPASRDKSNRFVTLPIGRLSSQLLSELKVITGHHPYLFGPKPLTDGAVHQMVERLIKGHIEHFSPKCLRSTCKTMMGGLGISKVDRDRYHGHALTDVSSRHYDRHDYMDDKKEVVRRWEAYITDLIAGNQHTPGLRIVS